MPPYTPRKSSNTALVAAAIVFGLLVVVAGGGFIAYRMATGGGLSLSLDRDEQIATRVDQLSRLVREDAALDQSIFWLKNGCTAEDCKTLKDDETQLKKEADVVNQKATSRWGDRLPGLEDMDPMRWERYELFSMRSVTKLHWASITYMTNDDGGDGRPEVGRDGVPQVGGDRRRPSHARGWPESPDRIKADSPGRERLRRFTHARRNFQSSRWAMRAVRPLLSRLMLVLQSSCYRPWHSISTSLSGGPTV